MIRRARLPCRERRRQRDPHSARVPARVMRPRRPGAIRGQALIAALLVLTLLAAGGLLAGGELRAPRPAPR